MNIVWKKNNWISGLAIILILIIWQIAATFIRLPLILPTPAAALTQVMLLIGTKEFWHHLGATLGRGLIGFGFSLISGIFIGLLAGQNPYIKAFLRPIIIIMRSTPVISVIILALIWFQRDIVPIFVTFLMVFPIVVQNIIEGVQAVDSDLLEMVRVYKVNQWRRFTNLYLPSLLPYLAAGISAGLGITWKVLIAAEVLAYPQWGIGSQMDTARVYLQTDKVFAWTIVVVIMGIFFDYLLDYLLKKPFKAWKGVAHD